MNLMVKKLKTTDSKKNKYNLRVKRLKQQLIGDANEQTTESNVQTCYVDIMESAINAIEAKDPYTQGHSRRVSQLSELLAKYLALPKDLVEVVKTAALLHDIGKLGINEIILNKNGPLNDEERSEIKKHPQIGARILDPLRHLTKIIPAVLHHHERIDGKGYPAGLKDEEIPLIARIVGIADAFDAMTSTRPYRPAMDLTEAYLQLQQHRDQQFDGALVEAFCTIPVEEIEAILDRS